MQASPAPRRGDERWMLTLSVLCEPGALLTNGLVRPWGEAVPHWVPAAGRTVRPLAALVPAASGAVVLTVFGSMSRGGGPPRTLTRPTRAGDLVVGILHQPLVLRARSMLPSPSPTTAATSPHIAGQHLLPAYPAWRRAADPETSRPEAAAGSATASTARGRPTRRPPAPVPARRAGPASGRTNA